MIFAFGLILAAVTIDVVHGVRAIDNPPTPNIFDSFCPDVCPAVMKPVFDENGVMYTNECKMWAAKCKHKKKNADLEERSSSNSNVDDSRRCSENCPNAKLPIWGSDEVWYSNPCNLRSVACKNPELVAADDDACESFMLVNAITKKSSKTSLNFS